MRGGGELVGLEPLQLGKHAPQVVHFHLEDVTLAVQRLELVVNLVIPFVPHDSVEILQKVVMFISGLGKRVDATQNLGVTLSAGVILCVNTFIKNAEPVTVRLGNNAVVLFF